MVLLRGLVLFLSFMAALCAPVRAQDAPAPWRIRFVEAAVVQGATVLLGEVAVPVGEMPAGLWDQLAGRALWPSPPEKGRPVNMTRPRLQEAVMATMQDLAPYCLFPGSMALQRGGAVFGKEQVQDVAVKGLTPLLGQVAGEGSFRDFRLPQHIFLAHPNQRIVVEPPRRVNAGRVNFRLLVLELDGGTVQKIACSVFLDSAVDVPCAAVVLNKDDILEPGKITFKRMNLAFLREAPWDGRGGPWRITRPIGVQQVIYQSDVGHIPTVRKGTILTLVYEGKNMRLATKAEALADGVVGESIPVRNVQSKKELYGIVRDAATVVVTGAQ
jgi:flagella basal body P-ring formation protein FlgA